MNTDSTNKEHTAAHDDPEHGRIEPQVSGRETMGDPPTPDDEALEQAKDDLKLYTTDRPTVVLPGSNGTVSGTAINDWLDDDGNTIDHSKDRDGAAVGAVRPGVGP